MDSLGYYNGEWGPLESIKVPMLDRVCFYGDGCYDATISRNGTILFLDEHIARFYNSARLLDIQIEQTPEELTDLLYQMLAEVSGDANFVYWQVTRGSAPRSHWVNDLSSNLWIMIVPESHEELSVKADVVTFEDKRFEYCNIKTLNLIPNVLAAKKAAESDCYETIFVRDGVVTECAHSNVHILKDGALITHPADQHILPGIARAHLIAMCKQLEIPVFEKTYTLDELLDADEVIVSASSTFARGVAHVDSREVGGRAPELLARIQDALMREFFEATS